MSMVIDIENFSSFTAIFEEIDRRNKQNNPAKDISAKESNTTKTHKKLRKTQSVAVTQSKPSKQSRLERRGSEPTSSTLSVPQPRVRIRSAPSPVIDREKLEREPRLTEGAKKLSNEELALLYEDILKPLDFYAILHERRKEYDNLNRF